jgi:organic radical activating enzyme
MYNKGDDLIENIDEFIHVGRRKWDVIRYDGDPIYDIEGHLQLLPLQQPCAITTNSDIWQHIDEMITHLFQTPKDDLMQYSHDDF